MSQRRGARRIDPSTRRSGQAEQRRRIERGDSSATTPVGIFSSLLRQIRLAHQIPVALARRSPALVDRPDDEALAAAAVAGGDHRYGSSWNRLSGGAPASYFNIFRRGTETSLQTFRIFISSVGACQLLFDSQATFTQVILFSQEHTFTSRPAASTSSVRYDVLGLSLPSSKCTPCTSV